MRIAVIDPSLFTLPYDRALVEGLQQVGHTVRLYGRPLRPDDGAEAGAEVVPAFYRMASSRFVNRQPSSVRLALKGLDHAWSMARLLGRLRRERPDVIHFQWLPLPLIDSLLLDQFKRIAPLVLTVHDTNPFNGDPSVALQSRGFQRCLDKFDRLIVHTAQGELRLRRMGIPPGRISVQPHGLLVPPVPGEPDKMTGRLTFLLFGKIKPYKGADTLIEAFAQVAPELRDQASVKIVGKPYMDLEPLRALAEATGFLIDIDPGYLSDAAVAELFARPGTVAVFPYREIEASGVMFLAIANGRPIIASKLGSFAELLTDGTHGHLVPPDDPAALSAAITDMIADRTFAAHCAACVRSLADNVPSWQDIARRIEAIYRAAATARPAPTAPLVTAARARG